METIKERLQASEDEQADSYQLKTDEEIIDIISQFGNGITEFHTLDINRLILEKELFKKTQSILDEHNENLKQFEFDLSKLRSTMQFCAEHKFDEELRIARVKHESKQIIVSFYQVMINQIQAVLNSIK